MKHNKFNEILILTNAGIPTLLTGEKGSGKTSVAKQVAEGMKLPFYCISMTRQTTLSYLLGFKNINGTYIPTELREAAEQGGIFLLDEIDAGDANVLLCLNTIENGYISFPDGIVELHKDFHLIATSNPQDEHQHYTGRSKLDAATLDRFDIIDLDHDPELEQSLVDKDIYQHIDILRTILKNMNSSQVISMRDAIRFQKRKELNLTDDFIFKLTGKNQLIFNNYAEAISKIPKFEDQADCVTIDDLFDLIFLDYKHEPKPDTPDDIPF